MNPLPPLTNLHGEPSFALITPEVRLWVTQRAGHMAPAIFTLPGDPGREVSPYALAPWQPAEFPDIPPLLSVLRGDFFCLPFGGRQGGPPHGDPANAPWKLVDASPLALTLEQQATDTTALLRKTLSTRPGHTAVYAEHSISGLSGRYNYGTHPILDFSHLPTAAGRIAVSPFVWASVFPGTFSNPEAGETQCLQSSAEFTDLRAVPLAAGGTTDLTCHPDRAGNDDLVMLLNAPATPAQPFAWSAAVFDGWLWFALKNPVDFPATLLWISNRGRSAAPWLSRHHARVGIEEVCSYFCHGLEMSRDNPLAAKGIPTTREFTPHTPTSLRVVHAVTRIPDRFGNVKRILPHSDSELEIIGDSGQSVRTALDWRFVI